MAHNQSRGDSNWQSCVGHRVLQHLVLEKSKVTYAHICYAT